MKRRRFAIRILPGFGFAIYDRERPQPSTVWIGRAATLPAAFARIERYLERGW